MVIPRWWAVRELDLFHIYDVVLVSPFYVLSYLVDVSYQIIFVGISSMHVDSVTEANRPM